MSDFAAAVDSVVPAPGRRVVVVAASWHVRIMEGLLAGARRALDSSGARYRVVRVLGSFDLPVAAAAALDSGADAVIALGVMVPDGTAHFDRVCEGATNGLMSVSLSTGRPVGFGLLMADSVETALDRAGLADTGSGQPSREDRGFEAAVAVLSNLALLEELRS